MSPVIVNNIVSLDGFYSDASGNPLILQMDSAFDRANLASIEAADIVVLGRSSFEGFSSYWPFIADAEQPADSSAPEARAFDDVNRAISRRYNALPKVVVSDSGPVSQDNAWRHSTTVVARAAFSLWLKNNKDSSIVVFGSHILWNHLLAEGLVDEIHLMVSPKTLGVGTPAFTNPTTLELLEARTFEDSSNVQLRYRIARPETR